ncbi:hypothetical protein [Ruegeria faecimaris]|uniref:hypothetical protein n=1 Tax=Ruegeria faecimaris TaxID=686389 RepID=UPI0024915840|nr:hypothetical protein [Ruegeria faecimaris]
MSEIPVHFNEFRLTKSDLSWMTKEEMAVLGTLSFICNELNVFARFLRLTEQQVDDIGPVKFAADLQYNVVLRTLTSKAFEAHEFLRQVSKKAKSADSEIFGLVQKKEQNISELKSSDGRAKNLNIRNDVSFHYDFDLAKKNIKSLPEDADASVYLNSLDCNSYSVLGERLMFVERLRRFSDADKKFEDPDELAKSWIEWSSQVFFLIMELQSELIGLVLSKVGKVAKETSYFVEPEFIAADSDAVIPVFVRSDE